MLRMICGAYERMMSGQARFRVVLTMNPSESAR
jgi:D-arabinose 1-dehydrogenase-like Zn-dependent alcohol dehydrogenase